MKSISLLILGLSFLLFGCKKEEGLLVQDSEKLIGNWTNPVSVDTLWKYERVATLKENEYGFSFKESPFFSERKNAGWCGTPPISYRDFEGTWSRNNAEVTINVGYWGGTANYKWKIISVDDKTLIVYKIKEEFNFELGNGEN